MSRELKSFELSAPDKENNLRELMVGNDTKGTGQELDYFIQ